MSEIKIKLKNADIEAFIQIEKYPFPKYTSSVINLINGFAQGTRPKVVGQMSELIKEFNGHNLEEWISWYNEKEPNSIENATNRIFDKFIEIKEAVNQIDKNLIREWVKDLVYNRHSMD